MRRGAGGLVALAAALLAATAAAQLPIENIQLRGNRFRGLNYREMTEAQRVMLDHTVNSARAVTNTTANGPFNVLLRSPEVGDLSQALGNAIRFASGLTPAQREIATLMAGRAWSSRYEWYAHARYAADAGIPAGVIAAIAAHEVPDLDAMPPDEAAVWRVTDELLYTRRVTDETFRAALATLGERRLMSAVLIAAYYEFVSMVLNVDRYPLPADAPEGADRALAPLTPEALYRAPPGAVTPRPPLENRDTEQAIETLRLRLADDAELPAEVRDAALRAVERQWNHSAKARGGGVAYAFATELLDTREVSDATFARSLEALGERRLVNLIVLLGNANIRCAQAALAGVSCALTP